MGSIDGSIAKISQIDISQNATLIGFNLTVDSSYNNSVVIGTNKCHLKLSDDGMKLIQNNVEIDIADVNLTDALVLFFKENGIECTNYVNNLKKRYIQEWFDELNITEKRKIKIKNLLL